MGKPIYIPLSKRSALEQLAEDQKGPIKWLGDKHKEFMTWAMAKYPILKTHPVISWDGYYSVNLIFKTIDPFKSKIPLQLYFKSYYTRLMHNSEYTLEYKGNYLYDHPDNPFSSIYSIDENDDGTIEVSMFDGTRYNFIDIDNPETMENSRFQSFMDTISMVESMLKILSTP